MSLAHDKWRELTRDKWIHEVIAGNVLEFEEFPVQYRQPGPLRLHSADQQALDIAMLDFITHGIVEQCFPINLPCFYSNIFPVIKPDGTARLILNLKDFNLTIRHEHFKMDTIREVITLIYPNCYFVTVDFKHAYFSVSVRPEDRRWLRFLWRNAEFQFTCLPQGLTSAPRTFTRLLKPALAHLRSLGMVVSCYIDDCIFLAPSVDELLLNVKYALRLFDSLGLTIHTDKSMLIPSREVQFLGFILNSDTMRVSLPDRKCETIREFGRKLLREPVTSLRDLASFIGSAVATDPAVPLSPLRYKYLEIVRNKALVLFQGNYEGVITLDDRSRDLISWWVHNVHTQSKPMRLPSPSLELCTDASLTGWGATLGSVSTGGHWADEEVKHINRMELKATLLGLRSLCDGVRDSHIRIRSDNTTTVACIERCCSTKMALLELVEQIFQWAESRGNKLSAAYIKGTDNIVADRESRRTNIDTEWMLEPRVFRELCKRFTTPRVDLFACRLNAQLPYYVSWKPDPFAMAVDAFTISWANGLNYAFPPFSVIGRVLRKLQEDKAELLMILPLWPTQVWFPRVLQLLAEPPVLLPRNCLTLPQDPSLRHPLSAKLVLTAMVLSGCPFRREAFRQKLPNSFFRLGEGALNASMGVISRGGCHFVSSGKLILFSRL